LQGIEIALPFSGRRLYAPLPWAAMLRPFSPVLPRLLWFTGMLNHRDVTR